ncbi:MAG TPA: hypothetical protein VID47_13165 [Actinomycetota bacterium]
MAGDDAGSKGRASGYLGSTKNIAGCVLGAGGLALVFTGVVAMPVGALVVGALYGIGALVAPSRKRKDLMSGGFDADQVVDALGELQKEMRGKVPPDLEAKVTRITLSVQSVLPKARRLSGGSQYLFVLQRTATDYLPTTVHAYMDLPRAYADSHVIEEGKTAHQLVSEQLDVLASQMDEVVDAVNKGDVDSLLAQGRFLDEKFGKEGLSIEGPSAGTSPPAGSGSPAKPPAGGGPSPTSAPGDPPPPVTQF